MRKTLPKELRKIAKFYGVRLGIRKNIGYSAGGAAFTNDNYILVKTTYDDDSPLPENYIVSIFFHEMGHVIDFRNGIYKKYNSMFGDKKYATRFGLKAELHADQTGKKLAKKHYPKLKWVPSYVDQDEIDFFKQWLRSWK